MEYKDYYKILGVDRNASAEQIKQSYRKLAMRHHPDRNPGDKRAEEKFKEINEANQVLSDPEKRARYDQLGESYARWEQGGRPGGGFRWDDWYTTRPGGNVRVEVGDLGDLFGGGFSEFFSRIFGGFPDMSSTMRTGGIGQRRARSERPAYQQSVSISLAEAYQGTSRRIDMDGRRLEVKIPPGAKTGTKVRVVNAVPNEAGEQKSDLYLVIDVAEDPRFERKGHDLHTEIAVDLYTAVLGGEATVNTLAGNVVLTVPPGIQPGQVVRLAGRGMPELKSPGTYGDLLVHIKVKIPRNLTPHQRELFQELSRLQTK